MRRTIGIVLIVLTAFGSFAQTSNSPESSAHLVFRGVPIDGTLNEFILKMKKSGFTHVTTEDGVALLRGDFALYTNCMVGVSTLKGKDLVNKITVIFPEQDTWSSLYNNYSSLKEMLTDKYGQPADEIETFEGTNPHDDSARMYEVRVDRCKYITLFATAKGKIELSIEHDGVTSCYVMLRYFDKINQAIVKAKAMDDL